MVPKRDFSLEGLSFAPKRMPPSDHNPLDKLKSDFEITVAQDQELAEVMGITLNQLYSVYKLIYDLAPPTTDIDRSLILSWYLIKGQCSDIDILQVDSDKALKWWREARDYYLALASSRTKEYCTLLNRLNQDIPILDCY